LPARETWVMFDLEATCAVLEWLRRLGEGAAPDARGAP